MFKVTTLLLISTLSTQSLAECKQPVTPLVTGQTSPCDGFLFSPAKELELRKTNEDYKLLQEQIKIYAQQKELYEQEIKTSEEIASKEAEKSELWRNRAIDSTEKLTSTESNRGMRDWLFLMGGVLLTIGAGFAVGQAHK